VRGIQAEYLDLFNRYTRGPALIREAVRGMAFGAMNARRPGDDWSTRDIVIHLSDAEMVGGVRLRRLIAEDRPTLESFDQDLWKRRLQTLWRDTDGAIASFELMRWQTAEIIAHCDRAAWAREGVHTERGTVTVADLILSFTEHAEQHAEQIRRIREHLDA